MRIEIERFFQAVQKTIAESTKQTKLPERTVETLDELQKKENYDSGNKIRKQKDDANYFMKLVQKYKERFPRNPITITVEDLDEEGFKISEINIPPNEEKVGEKLHLDDYIWQAMPYKNLTAEEKYRKYNSIITRVIFF